MKRGSKNPRKVPITRVTVTLAAPDNGVPEEAFESW